MSIKEYFFSFKEKTDSPTHRYAAKRIYLQKLTEEEWQQRVDLGAEESTKQKFESQDKQPKKKTSKKVSEK
jgi:hypothetical protein